MNHVKQFKRKQVFPSPSADGSFEILPNAAGNSPPSEWDNKPGTSTVAPLRDFQSETNRLRLLQFQIFVSHQGRPVIMPQGKVLLCFFWIL